MIQQLVFIIQYDGEKYKLDFSPEEWDESSIRWKRSLKYFGISREFSLPLKFVKDGAKLLRWIFYNGNIEEEAKLIIYTYIDLTEGYQKIYKGEFDFSTFNDQDDYVEISIADNGIEADIKANESTEYEFDISDAKHKVSMPEIPKIDKAEGNVSSTDWTAKYMTPSYVFTDTDQIDESKFIVNSPDQGSTTNWNNIVSPSQNFHVIEGVQNTTIHVKLSLSIAGIKERGYSNIMFAVYDDEHDDNTNETSGIVHKEVFVNGVFNFEFDLSVEAERKYFFIFRTTPNSLFFSDDMPVINAEDSAITISYSNPTEQLEFPAFRADEVFNMLMEKMTGINPEFEDDALGDIKITSGDGIRNISDAKLKTSFDDYFKSIHSVTGYCMGLENGLPVLKQYGYFFNQNLNITTLGNITEMELKPASDFLYGKIKVGYKNQNYEEELGRDEYNTEQTYSTGLNRTSKTLDLVSTYRADHLGIRKIRIDLEHANSTDEDRQADNDIFMIYTDEPLKDGQPYPAITAEDFQLVNGIDGRTDAINIPISPKRNLLAHGEFLSSALFRTNAILFETAKKDVALESSDEVEMIIERRNVYLSELPDALFLPIVAKFTAPINISNIFDLKNKENGYLSFKFRGRTFSGFVLEISANISYSESVEVTVLLSQNNNLENLIK